jgi:predicted esterase
MDNKCINIPFKAPYVKVGTISNLSENVWLIFHGYGQLAEEFAGSFTELFTGENCVIFPQGLSKFYLKGVDKNIGANWMTSHDRELDIENYLNYIDGVFDVEISPHQKNIKINLLGFSQGGHTMSRWVNHAKINYHKLVLWGSGLAHEISQNEIAENFSKGENILVIGDKDRFINSDQLLSVKRRYSKIGFKYKLIEYHGGHDIYPDILRQIYY